MNAGVRFRGTAAGCRVGDLTTNKKELHTGRRDPRNSVTVGQYMVEVQE